MSGAKLPGLGDEPNVTWTEREEKPGQPARCAMAGAAAGRASDRSETVGNPTCSGTRTESGELTRLMLGGRVQTRRIFPRLVEHFRHVGFRLEFTQDSLREMVECVLVQRTVRGGLADNVRGTAQWVAEQLYRHIDSRQQAEALWAAIGRELGMLSGEGDSRQLAHGESI